MFRYRDPIRHSAPRILLQKKYSLTNRVQQTPLFISYVNLEIANADIGGTPNVFSSLSRLTRCRIKRMFIEK